MKKIVMIAMAFLMLGFVAYADDWARVHNIEQYFKLFEVEVEVWFNPVEMVLNFEDSFSKDFDDMLFQWGYLMTAFEFMLQDSGQLFEDLNVDLMVYSFFLVIDNRVSKYDLPNHRYDVFMERWWCIKYFQANKRQRQEMLYSLFDEHYMEWFPSKRQF